MSDEDDNYNINKNRISEDEEGEEKDETEQKPSSKKKNKKTNVKINFSESENSNNNSENGEENNESEDNSKMNNSMSSENESNDESYNNNKKLTKEQYIAKIEQLSNELKLEKKINSKLDDNEFYDEVTKLKNELNKKSNNLERLIISNRKQKLALDKLTNEVEHINKKKIAKEENDEVIIKEGGSMPNIRDRELYRAINKMNTIKKENEKMKNILYQNEDYNYKTVLEDKRKEILNKIENKNNEKDTIIKQLEEHKICIKEQKELNTEYNGLKEELKELKKNIQNIRIKAEKLINSKNNKNKINNNNNNNNISISKNSSYFFKKNNNTKININLVKKKFSSNSTPNIRLNKSNVIYPNKNNQNNKKVVLPLLFSSSMNNQNKSILNKTFTERIKEFLDGDEDQYMTLINKINNIENNRRIIENKNLNEIKKINSEILSLDEKCKYLNFSSKESNNNLRILKNKLNIIKVGNKKQLKKFNELKKELQSKINISKEKDKEISLLLTEINEIRNTVKNDEIRSTQDDIVNYIKKIKKERGVEETYTESEKETEKNNENIQVDFTDSYDN